MNCSQLFEDGFARIDESVRQVLEGLPAQALTYRPDGKANTIAWLIWHLSRIEDDHIAGVTGEEQVWTADGWSERFALALDVSDTGYGHDARQVAAVAVSGELLGGYFEAAHNVAIEFVSKTGERDLDRIVDERWDPPVTLGVRLISVQADALQHAGQAAYVRGMFERTRS